MNLLEELQKWFFRHCNGDWEHCHGVQLTTLDNPGWILEIDLDQTELADLHFMPLIKDLDGEEWLRCEVKDKVFLGSGGPEMLTSIIKVFIDWSKSVQ